MAANGNGNGVVTHVVLSHDAKDLESVLRMIREDKRTGSLVINFSQGTPSGRLEWKEKAPASSNYGPIRSLVK